jgi:hypothetical protein
MKLPTVKIVNEKKDGFVEINESDFDKEKHVLWKQEVKKPKELKKKVKKKIKKEEK